MRIEADLTALDRHGTRLEQTGRDLPADLDSGQPELARWQASVRRAAAGLAGRIEEAGHAVKACAANYAETDARVADRWAGLARRPS
ncbi:hypothetical protein [Hamadaea tsunoensis]|uniref:hypothetical protein n=1 Tax=Hamadaea tsunoensis TaxID=53368 RepID=UPI00040A6FA3|nr:hypothetical protein [Hamadaea tsunoensis]